MPDSNDISVPAVQTGSSQVHNYLTEDEAAQFLRLSPRTLQRHRLDGTGSRFVRAGRRVLYRVSDLEAWLSANTFLSTSEADTTT